MAHDLHKLPFSWDAVESSRKHETSLLSTDVISVSGKVALVSS
jgi:hypothetical protein